MDKKVSKSFEDYEKEFKKLNGKTLQTKYRGLLKQSDEYGRKKSQLMTKTRGDYHKSPEWGPLYNHYMNEVQQPMIVLERLMEARGIEIPKREN
jgi:hypothetical protein